ncbi:MAG: MlaD family protein [Solirubrobacteraceae bacterium]
MISPRLRLELRRARRPLLWIGWLLLCAALASWVVFRNQTFERPWAEHVQVRVAVDDAKGVQVNHQVRVAGVVVGVVKRIDLTDHRPVLTLSLERRYAPVYRDARLRVRPQTPLNDMYVAIEDRGSPRAGVLGAEQVLAAERTTSPVDVSRVLNTFDADTRVRLGRVLDGLQRGLDDEGGRQLRAAFAQLGPFLHGARRLTGVLAERRATMRRLVHATAGVSGAVAVRDRQLGALVHSGGATLRELARRDEPLARSLAELPETLDALDRGLARVQAAQDDVDPALVALRPVARRLEPGLRALERFGTDARPAVRALRPSVVALEPLADALRPTAVGLQRSFARLRPQAPRLDRVTAKVEGCLMPAQKFLHWSLSVFKFGDANAAYTRAASTLGLDSVDGALAEPHARHEKDCAE